MALTPLDIHHKEFRTARFGGYNEEEVDSFLDLVADEFEKMIQEGTELKYEIEHLKKRLSEFEEMQAMLQSALLAATKSAETVKEQAREESEAVVAKAQEGADTLVKDAQEKAREMILRAENETQDLERSSARLKEIKRSYMKGLKEVAESHLLQVEELESMGESEMQPEELQPAIKSPNIEEEPAPILIEEPPMQDPPERPSAASILPAAQEPRVAESTVQPIEQISPIPTIESSAATQIDREVVELAAEATGGGPPTTEEKSRVADWTGMQNKLIEPKFKAAQGGGRIDVVEKDVPSSSDLVDEVLPVKDRERIYSEFEDIEGDTERGQTGRKGRRDKREKHFFWE